MKITLDIKDSKASAFVNFVKSLDFVKIQNSEDETELSKEEALLSLEQSLKEVKLHQEGKIKLQSAQEFLDEL
ncbi:MAG: hypothetical protein RIC80_03995 [Cyclobacteriaceae bacterium]